MGLTDGSLHHQKTTRTPPKREGSAGSNRPSLRPPRSSRGPIPDPGPTSLSRYPSPEPLRSRIPTRRRNQVPPSTETVVLGVGSLKLTVLVASGPHGRGRRRLPHCRSRVGTGRRPGGSSPGKGLRSGTSLGVVGTDGRGDTWGGCTTPLSRTTARPPRSSGATTTAGPSLGLAHSVHNPLGTPVSGS